MKIDFKSFHTPRRIPVVEDKEHDFESVYDKVKKLPNLVKTIAPIDMRISVLEDCLRRAKEEGQCEKEIEIIEKSVKKWREERDRRAQSAQGAAQLWHTKNNKNQFQRITKPTKTAR